MQGLNNKLRIEKYSEYKSSKVEWLGEIPKHWGLNPGFTVIEERKEKNLGLRENTVLSLSYGNVVVKPAEKLTGLVPESFETYQLVYPGDIIIRPTDLQNDKTSLRTGLSKDKGIITSAYINLKIKVNLSSKYYHYFLHSVDTTKLIYGLGSGLRQNLDYNDFKRFPFLVPPLPEQTAIADFLDRKTSQIDQAIRIKEKQIALLKERRQILIHRAVTRGLDPNVKMKDSGVEWIGEIPEHLEVKRFKNIVDIKMGYAFPSEKFTDTGIPVVRIGDLLSNGNVDINSSPRLPEKYFGFNDRFGLKYDDILLAMTGGTIGKIAEFKLHEIALLNQRVCSIKIKSDYSRDLILYWMKSNYWMEYILFKAYGGAQPNISDKDILECKIVIPLDIEEQIAIANSIKNVICKIANAIVCKEKEIEKLKEYKATLINSAVTGKIKVV